MRGRFVTDAYHARFSAKGKIYRYRVWNGPILPPVEVGRAWRIALPLDRDKMRSEAALFLGKHDFASFAANRGKPGEDTIRTIRSVKLRERGQLIELDISGDGFLYKMVRLIVGALARSAGGKSPEGEICERLENPRRPLPKSRFVAPAEGLYLVRVIY